MTPAESFYAHLGIRIRPEHQPQPRPVGFLSFRPMPQQSASSRLASAPDRFLGTRLALGGPRSFQSAPRHAGIQDTSFEPEVMLGVGSHRRKRGSQRRRSPKLLSVPSKSKSTPVSEVRQTSAPSVLSEVRPTPAPRVLSAVRPTPAPRVLSAVRPTPAPRVLSAVRSTPVPRVLSAVRSTPVPRVLSAVRSTPVPRVLSAVRLTPVPRVLSAFRPTPVPRVLSVGEVVVLTPLFQGGHLLPVSHLVAMGDQPHNCCVVRKLHDGV
ncbi:uncharacterized protein LOC141766873 [Sebastes fasciatus]|uniref:uncharacterized protein LOC141766873 n=1 Tax=Sebastes fasciatus TaxID=394691 RepID=UPI003D9EB753